MEEEPLLEEEHHHRTTASSSSSSATANATFVNTTTPVISNRGEVLVAEEHHHPATTTSASSSRDSAITTSTPNPVNLSARRSSPLKKTTPPLSDEEEEGFDTPAPAAPARAPAPAPAPTTPISNLLLDVNYFDEEDDEEVVPKSADRKLSKPKRERKPSINQDLHDDLDDDDELLNLKGSKRKLTKQQLEERQTAKDSEEEDSETSESEFESKKEGSKKRKRRQTVPKDEAYTEMEIEEEEEEEEEGESAELRASWYSSSSSDANQVYLDFQELITQAMLNKENPAVFVKQLKDRLNDVSAAGDGKKGKVMNIYERSAKAQRESNEESEAKRKYGSEFRLWNMYFANLSTGLYLITGLSFALENQTEQFLRAMLELDAFPNAQEFDDAVNRLTFQFYYSVVKKLELYLLSVEKENETGGKTYFDC